MKKQVLLLIFSITLLSCGNNSNRNEQKTSTTDNILDSITIDEVETTPQIYDIKGSNIFLRDSPSENGKKIVNEKATEALGTTEYLEVDNSCRVKILEEKDNWIKIQVVDPEWLTSSHIGWINKKYIVTDEEDKNYKLNKNDFEILKKEENPAVTNYYIYYKSSNKTEDEIAKFIKAFNKDSCTSNCNIYVYDTKTITNLIDKYPLEGAEYIKVADHFIASKYFDDNSYTWYPFQDIQYKKYGGKNWKKEPIK